MPSGFSGAAAMSSQIPVMPRRCRSLLARPGRPLPRLFVLARVGEMIAMPAQESAMREVQLDHALSATSSTTSSSAATWADEIGAIATGVVRHADDRDDLGHHPLLALLLALPLSIPGTSTAAPDTAMPGEMQALSLGVQVDGE